MTRLSTTPRATAALALLAPMLFACAKRDDDYLLLKRPWAKPGAPTPPLELASPNDATAYYLRYQLANGFGAELLRTYAMTKRFAARTYGRRETPTTFVLGRPGRWEDRAADRQVRVGWWRTTLDDDTPILWIDDAPEHDGRVLIGELVETFGWAILDLIHLDSDSDGSALARGYIRFLAVVAAEWRAPTVIDDRDQLRRSSIYAEVRENDAVIRRAESPRAMIADPSVVATVLYRLASSDLRQRMADPAVYKPFIDVEPPRDVHPALLLGAFRNFQAKLIAAWSRARAAGQHPRNLIDLVEAYGDAYPEEREEATRIFLVTTHGATVLPAAASADLSPERAEPRFAALMDDIVSGRRGLRDGFCGRP